MYFLFFRTGFFAKIPPKMTTLSQKCVKLRKITTIFAYMQIYKNFFQKKEWRHFFAVTLALPLGLEPRTP